MSETPTGWLCWYDLMTTNPEGAPSFYGEITGWGTQPFEGSPEPYTLWTNDETPIGGMMQLPQDALDAGAPPNWLVHISTPDVKATAAKAQELGATVLHEERIPKKELGGTVVRAPWTCQAAISSPITWTPMALPLRCMRWRRPERSDVRR